MRRDLSSSDNIDDDGVLHIDGFVGRIANALLR